MKARSSEAARLEADYMTRLKAALGHLSASEKNDILQEIAQHIEDSCEEFAESEISLSQMAQILDRLGAPQVVASAAAASGSRSRSEVNSGAECPENKGWEKDRKRYAELLQKLWFGHLTVVLGIYIPGVNFYVSSMVGLGILSYFSGIREVSRIKIFRRIRWAALIAALLCPVSLINNPVVWHAYPATMLLAPLGMLRGFLVWLVYWSTLTGCAECLELDGQNQLAATIRTKRNLYIFICVVGKILMMSSAMILGLVYARMNMKLPFDLKDAEQYWWTGLLFLPLQWLLGWIFVLDPIKQTQRILAGKQRA
jgi:uncharacterized membrane protein